MYHFFAILYYFGVAIMPSKSDYWSMKEWMPKHSIVHEFGMTCRRFEFIWRNFHPCFEESDNDDVELGPEATEETNESQSLETCSKDDDDDIERIQADQQVLQSDGNTTGEDTSIKDAETVEEQRLSEEEKDNDTQQSSKKKVWYEKLTWMIDHIRDASQEFIFVIGTILSLNEMMIRFFGRLKETHQMKKKPIKEGYNFFCFSNKRRLYFKFYT